MTRYLVLFLLVVGIFVIGKEGCTMFSFNIGAEEGKGPIQSETRTLEAFSGIQSSLAADIEVEHSDESRIEISMQENLLPLFKSEVNGDELKLEFNKNVNTNKPIKIKVYTAELDAIEINGAGNMKMLSGFNGEQLRINISGVSDVVFPQASYSKISCDMSGSGSITIGGQADELRAHVSGVGSVHAGELQVKNCDVDISGSGNVQCAPADQLKAHVSGVGSVKYKGHPQVESHVSGAGSVDRED